MQLVALKPVLRKFKLLRWCLNLNIIKTIRDELLELSPYVAVPPAGLMINIGAGAFKCKNWVNLDYISDWYEDMHKGVSFIPYDIRNDLMPFEDESVFCAYCSHVIEHIETPHIEKMFKEVYRILGRGGVFRLAFPDASFLYNVTLLQKQDYWYWRLKCMKSNFPVNNQRIPSSVDFLVREIATPKSTFYRYAINPISPEVLAIKFRELTQKEFLDFITERLEFRPTYPGDHINWWDFEKCKNLLLKAGFKDVFSSKYRGSITPYMRGNVFDNTMSHMSCYVECIK